MFNLFKSLINIEKFEFKVGHFNLGHPTIRAILAFVCGIGMLVLIFSSVFTQWIPSGTNELISAIGAFFFAGGLLTFSILNNLLSKIKK